MWRKLLYLLRLAVFWMLFFQAGRLVFMLYNHEKFSDCTFTEKLSAFLHAWPLDLSATCYMVAIPFLISLVSHFIRLQRIVRAQAIFNHVLVAVMTIVTFTDAVLYHEWGYKLNAYALSFTRYPREVMASIAGLPWVWIVLVLVAFAAAAMLLLQRIVHLHQYALMNNTMPDNATRLRAGGILLLQAFAIFTGIRGGLGVVPINQSAVFFSGKAPLNHAAVNPEWNLMYSFFNAGGLLTKNPYDYLPAAEARQRVEALYNTSAAHDSVLLTQRPNILLVMLESWTANVIEKLGGEPHVTDSFNNLCNDGLLFTNLYASGDRTDKGLIAIYSGYPAQPTSSIISQPEKLEKLPCLTRPFIANGYQSLFYYGGESEFANMRAYLYHCGFQQVIDRNSFERKDMNSKWGAHDGVVFNRVLADLNKQQQPFFCGMLTLSSHEPFEIPVTPPQAAHDEAGHFRNAVWYSDKCLGAFMAEARKQPWYANTLIILVADHGHRLPANYIDLSVPGRYRIPLLLTGGALKPEWRGKICAAIGNQTDISKTLLTELGLSDTAFHWSKDLLNPQATPFAYYVYTDGFGWVTSRHAFVYDNTSHKIGFPYRKTFPDSAREDLRNGQAYLRYFFDDYMAR